MGELLDYSEEWKLLRQLIEEGKDMGREIEEDAEIDDEERAG